MLHKLSGWLWGPSSRAGCSVLAGLGVVILVMVAVISLDLFGVTRQVESPPYLGADTLPKTVEVCDDLAGGLEMVQKSDAAWQEHGWPQFPEAVLVECENPHAPAKAGVVRWHSCDSLREVGEDLGPGCPATASDVQRNGSTYVQVVDGAVVAADVYIQEGATACTAAHEGGHIRGLVALPDEDEATPYVAGGHTERPGHLMAESCGDGWSWLDRREGGDWPHGPIDD